MYTTTIRHWLPRIATQLITALEAAQAAAENGNRRAQRTAQQDAAQFAHIAWRAIARAGQPRGIAAHALVRAGLAEWSDGESELRITTAGRNTATQARA